MIVDLKPARRLDLITPAEAVLAQALGPAAGRPQRAVADLLDLAGWLADCGVLADRVRRAQARRCDPAPSARRWRRGRLVEQWGRRRLTDMDRLRRGRRGDLLRRGHTAVRRGR